MTSGPRPLATPWFARPAPAVAPDLLGCFLVRDLGEGPPIRGLIVETEAYSAQDPACHGYRGLTPRNRVLFGPPGRAYVYISYGIHHCCNVVTGCEGEASGVLLRALWFPHGPSPGPGDLPGEHRRAAGPGKLCRALGIHLGLNGAPLEPGSGLWVESGDPALGVKWPKIQTTRVGITKGGETPWRWLFGGCPAVSKGPLTSHKKKKEM